MITVERAKRKINRMKFRQKLALRNWLNDWYVQEQQKLEEEE